MALQNQGIARAGHMSQAARAVFLLAGLAVAIALFYFGGKPVAVGLVAEPWDKLAHFAVYSAITALLLLGTRMRWPIATLLLVCMIGGCDELRQLWLPGRSADVGDLVADIAAGIATCLLLLHLQDRARVQGGEYDALSTQDHA
jgi:VanZ family protein